MNTIKTVCAEIENRIFSDSRVTRESFFPPLTEDQIRKTLSQREWNPSAELIQLYGWRNGQDHRAFFAKKSLPMFERYFFLPLEIALQRTPKPGELDDWGPAWLPILDDYAGDCLYVDLSSKGVFSVGMYATTSGEPTRGHVKYKSILELLLDVVSYWESQSKL